MKHVLWCTLCLGVRDLCNFVITRFAQPFDYPWFYANSVALRNSLNTSELLVILENCGVFVLLKQWTMYFHVTLILLLSINDRSVLSERQCRQVSVLKWPSALCATPTFLFFQDARMKMRVSSCVTKTSQMSLAPLLSEMHRMTEDGGHCNDGGLSSKCCQKSVKQRY